MRGAIVLLTLLVASFSLSAGGPTDALEGPWLIDAISVVSEHGEISYPDPAPGLFIFSRGYYSMVWMLTTEPLPDSAEMWRPTEKEKVRSFESMIVNSGTYALTDSLLTTRPVVAKTPEFVGGVSVFTYHVKADTLWMEAVDTRSHDGVQDPGIGNIRLPLRLVRPWVEKG